MQTSIRSIVECGRRGRHDRRQVVLLAMSHDRCIQRYTSNGVKGGGKQGNRRAQSARVFVFQRSTTSIIHLIQTRPSLIHENLALQLFKVDKEALKESNGMLDIIDASTLTDTVHAELRVSEIERARAERRGQHRPDGAAAGRVIAHHEQLQRHSGRRC